MPWHRRHHRGREAAIAIAFVIGGAVLLIFFISMLHNAKSQTLGKPGDHDRIAAARAP
jgi:hypothetical protein